VIFAFHHVNGFYVLRISGGKTLFRDNRKYRVLFLLSLGAQKTASATVLWLPS